jgi:hypothetical protein
MKRTLALVGGTLGILLAMASVSWTPATALQLTDESGAPASGAYARYHYTGSLLNPVDSLTYVSGGSVIVRADAEGRVRIPGRVHLRRPLPLSTPPALFVDHLYVPRLHNAFGPLGDDTISHPGVFLVDSGRKRVAVLDVSGHPEHWERSLRTLFDCIRETLSVVGSSAPAAPGDAQTAAYARELIAHLREEYASFLTRHGATPRTRPPAPQAATEEERRRWAEQADAHIAREPLWGPYVERMWRGDLQALARLEREIR